MLAIATESAFQTALGKEGIGKRRGSILLSLLAISLEGNASEGS